MYIVSKYTERFSVIEISCYRNLLLTAKKVTNITFTPELTFQNRKNHYRFLNIYPFSDENYWLTSCLNQPITIEYPKVLSQRMKKRVYKT